MAIKAGYYILKAEGAPDRCLGLIPCGSPNGSALGAVFFEVSRTPAPPRTGAFQPGGGIVAIELRDMPGEPPVGSVKMTDMGGGIQVLSAIPNLAGFYIPC